MAGRKNEAEPTAPTVIETSHPEDSQEAVPVDRVEGLPEIKLEDHRGSFLEVATADEVSGVDYVFRDSTTGKETSLVSIHKRVNGRLEA
jgi:hypothetical protein